MKVKIAAVILFIFSMIAVWSWLDYQNAVTEPVVKSKTLIKIEKGDSVNKILTKLHQAEIDVNDVWFKLLAYQKNIGTKLKVGEYELATGLTLPQILALFTTGKTHQYSITFPEGWTFKQMLQKLKQHPDLKHTVENMTYQEILAKLNSDKNHPEGLFFPDTYFFAQNATDFSILKKAYNKMQRVLNEEWQQRERDLPLQNPYEALILASIVEKETAVTSERPLIAGVFIHRLKIDMMLQTDPTVIYGMGENYRGNIRKQDLLTPTPYNTYVIKGLPPTPIAMPGKEAIKAVLHPVKTKNLYFVARGNGTHVFSPTLKEHNQAVDQFQRHSKKP